MADEQQQTTTIQATTQEAQMVQRWRESQATHTAAVPPHCLPDDWAKHVESKYRQAMASGMPAALDALASAQPGMLPLSIDEGLVLYGKYRLAQEQQANPYGFGLPRGQNSQGLANASGVNPYSFNQR